MKHPMRIQHYIQASFMLFFLAMSAHAQESMKVSDILAKGGKKLTKEEVGAKFAVVITEAGVLAVNPNRKAVNTFNPDGTFAGRTSDLNGNDSYAILGKWSINELGQTCVSQVRNTFGQDATPSSPCSFHFVLGDTHYRTTSDSPDSLAYRRQYQ